MKLLTILILVVLLAGCSSYTPELSSPIPAVNTAEAPEVTRKIAIESLVPTVEPIYQSNGGGEPRTTLYWVNWSSCGDPNLVHMAAANGGRAAGWVLMDDTLIDPGILVGEIEITSCVQGVNLLQQRNFDGIELPNNGAFGLAAQILAAQINLAAGAESCIAVESAIKSGQLLLISLGFDGIKDFSGTPIVEKDTELITFLSNELALYNAGTLCR